MGPSFPPSLPPSVLPSLCPSLEKSGAVNTRTEGARERGRVGSSARSTPRPAIGKPARSRPRCRCHCRDRRLCLSLCDDFQFPPLTPSSEICTPFNSNPIPNPTLAHFCSFLFPAQNTLTPQEAEGSFDLQKFDSGTSADGPSFWGMNTEARIQNCVAYDAT